MVDDWQGPSVAILYKDRLHPVHARIAESIGADHVHFPAISNDLLTGSVLEDIYGIVRRGPSIPTGYDVYLSEDAIGLYAAPYIASRTDATHIYLAANHRTYGFGGYDMRSPRRLAPAVKRIDRTIDVTVLRALLRRYVDGVLAVSDLMARNVADIAPNVPVRIAHPYVEPGLFERLAEVQPDLARERAVFVGKNRPHKGVDLLVQAWPQVRERYPDATLDLVGLGHEDPAVEGVNVAGYVEDIADGYRGASLYVQPARFDPFPVSVLEAMRAGLPAIGTVNCGVSPYLSNVDDALSCRVSPDALADAIASYFDRGVQERQRLSGRVRSVAEAFDPRRGRRAFVEQFYRLLDDVGSEDDRRT